MPGKKLAKGRLVAKPVITNRPRSSKAKSIMPTLYIQPASVSY